jgi:glucose/arabinose dehydrogenase
MSLSACLNSPLSEAALPDGFCAGILPVQIRQPRTIISLGVSDFLALERGTESVVVAEDLDGDGIPETVRPLVSAFPELNHGLEITSTHLYASISSHVYRWTYDPIAINVTGDPQVVIENINADGMGGAPQGHTTRTLAIDKSTNILYVSVGSNDNIDPDSFRSRIRRFPIDNETLFPFNFQTGEVFADGIRNEVALEFAPDGILWGAMNAADRLYHPDLGGDIYNDNPAEEVHRFTTEGQNYGYPYCWREYNLPLGIGRGTAWAWPNSSLLSKVVTDDECRSNYDVPVLAMQAHSAPLGMTFYQYKDDRPTMCDGVIPFPQTMDGFAFVAFHGSWNRDVPTGYKVVYFPITDDGAGVVGGISANPTDLLWHNGTNANWSDGFRPVDVSFDACGRLLVSSDGSADDNDVFFGDYVVRVESTQAFTTAPPTSSPVPGTTVPNTTTSMNPSGVPIVLPNPSPSTVQPSRLAPSISISLEPSNSEATPATQESLLPSLEPSLVIVPNSAMSTAIWYGRHNSWFLQVVAAAVVVVLRT